MKTETIPFEDLDDEGADFVNPRQHADANGIKELAASIHIEGLLYPLQVWRTEDLGQEVNIVVDGRRRLFALGALKKAKKLGALIDVPCIVIDAKTIGEARIKALTGNLQREDLSTYEIAAEMAALKKTGLSGKDIAKRIGKSAAWVSRQLSAHTGASMAVKKAWKQRVLPDEAVQTLAKLTKKGSKEPDHAEQNSRLQKILEYRENGDPSVEIAGGGAGGRRGRVDGKDKAKTAKKPSKAKAATAARNIAKTGERVVKPNSSNLKSFATQLEKAPKSSRYIQGVRDALRFAMGELGYGEFSKELQDFANKGLKTDRKPIALGSGKKPAAKKE